MRYRMRIEHLPTGKTWTSEPVDMISDRLTEMRKFIIESVSDEYVYTSTDLGDREIFLNEHILKDCVFSLIEEPDHESNQ